MRNNLYEMYFIFHKKCNKNINKYASNSRLKNEQTRIEKKIDNKAKSRSWRLKYLELFYSFSLSPPPFT